MTEQDRPNEQPQFETDTAQANQTIEQGQGVGERELQAQREAGETVDNEVEQDNDDTDETTMERDTAVQGQQTPEA